LQDDDAPLAAFNHATRDQYLVLGRSRWSAPDAHDIVEMVQPPYNSADGWTMHVHPDGWVYFHRFGVITNNRALAQRPLVGIILERELDGSEYEEYLSLSSPGNQPTRVYINHESCYASGVKEDVCRADILSSTEGLSVFFQYISMLMYFYPGVNEFRIRYWTFMVMHPSHRALHPAAEEAA
jgi:hypothetical protein